MYCSIRIWERLDMDINRCTMWPECLTKFQVGQVHPITRTYCIPFPSRFCTIMDRQTNQWDLMMGDHEQPEPPRHSQPFTFPSVGTATPMIGPAPTTEAMIAHLPLADLLRHNPEVFKLHAQYMRATDTLMAQTEIGNKLYEENIALKKEIQELHVRGSFQ